VKTMETKEAIEKLKRFDCEECKLVACERCKIDYEEVQAIKRVLEALEIAEAAKEVVFEQGYKKGKEKGTEEAFYRGLAMGLQRRMEEE
jgi:flagellar biosynthesis/type III secretory pathway protein FliH